MNFSLGGKISLKDRIILTQQLSVMLKAGITLVQALKGLAEESSSRAMQTVLTELATDLEGGLSFSSALMKHPKVFSVIFCQMIKSAEKTGNIADVLEKLTVQQQKEFELKSKVKGALIYPAVVGCLLIAVMIVVVVFILPKLSVVFLESGTALPASTRFLLGLSDFMIHQWYILVAILIGLIMGYKMAVRTPQGKRLFDQAVIRVPVIGSLLKKTYLARFTSSFASLAEAGVPVLEIFKTLEGVIGNVIYEEALKAIAQDVENGVKVSIAIRKSKHFPGMVGQLVSVGEQSGNLAEIFSVLGLYFEKEVDNMAKNLSTLLEPIIMIIMGTAIGFVLISVLQPIYGLVDAV